jgi:hypothetical protein
MQHARHNPAVIFSYRLAILLLVLSVAALHFPLEALAQGCAMCQTVMPRGDEPMARGMFWSVFLLMTAPFIVGLSIGGWLFYQYRNARRAQRTAATVLPLHLAYMQKEGQP